MMSNKNILYPSLFQRIFSVWNRHRKVYTKNLISNGFPPFLEPLFFLAAFGLGFTQYLIPINGIPYLQFLASGLLVTSAMFTAAFECSYGTFIRLEFDKVYEGMLSAPITVKNLLTGEILWCGTKGIFFSMAVLSVLYLFNILPLGMSLLTPIVGFFTGILFAALSLLITSFVHNINYFNFYFTGLLTPMFFFSGVMFPLENLPGSIQILAEFFPLTHVTRITRAVCFSDYQLIHLWSAAYIILATLILSFFAMKRLEKRLID